MLMKTTPLTMARPAAPAADLADADAHARLAAQIFDRGFHAVAARFSGGLSRISLSLAYTDWALHMATQPANARRSAHCDAPCRCCVRTRACTLRPCRSARIRIR